MDKMMIAQSVANRLFATETAVDNAMSEAALLMSEMITARRELRVSAVVGDAAQTKVAEALATLAEARNAVVAAHSELNEIKASIGIRTRMVGEHPKSLALLAPAREEAVNARQAS